MYIHVGKTSYGTCDAVPELFYVSTLFWHFDYIPLPAHRNTAHPPPQRPEIPRPSTCP